MWVGSLETLRVGMTQGSVSLDTFAQHPSPSCCQGGSTLDPIERQGSLEAFSAAGMPLKSPLLTGNEAPSLGLPQLLKWL